MSAVASPPSPAAAAEIARRAALVTASPTDLATAPDATPALMSRVRLESRVAAVGTAGAAGVDRGAGVVVAWAPVGLRSLDPAPAAQMINPAAASTASPPSAAR